MPDVDSKVCTKCKADLPLSEYWKKSSGKGGLRARCKACLRFEMAARRRQRGAEDPEFYREHYRKYGDSARKRKAANPERARETNRKSYIKNRDKIREKAAAYREKHRERLREEGRERYRADPKAEMARVAAYNKANPASRRGINQRRRARMRSGHVVHFTADQLALRMSYFGDKCWMCSGDFETIDHVKPISKGGSHMLSNLRPACRSCNSSKSAKWPFTLEDATWLCP